MVAYICNPSTWEVEAERLGVQSYSQLQSKFEVTTVLYKTVSQNKKKKKRSELIAAEMKTWAKQSQAGRNTWATW